MVDRRIAGFFILVASVFFLSSCAANLKEVGRPTLVTVSGKVLEPASGAYLYLYKKGKDPHGPADYILPVPTGKDGSFALNVEPGEYVLVARKRSSGENTGPLKPGDLKSEEIPIKVKPGEPLVLTVVMMRKTDSAIKSYENPRGWNTSISGRVLDADGNPVAGARVHVYTYVQMSERPKYVSDKTGPDGKYIVYLPKGGTYYLAARNRFGGPPRIGDLYGRYDKGSIDPSAVVVKDGEHLEGIDIIVYKVW